jgi:Polyketide cyclase / dehydrase and lipid transport
MNNHARSLETSAMPERVWRIWSDTSTWSRWNPDVISISLEGAFASGTTGTMTTRAGGTHSIELEDVQAARTFTIRTSPAPLSTFHFMCEVAPANDGSRITQGVTMTGLLGGLMSAMMGERVAAGFEAILEGLKKEAEST